MEFLITKASVSSVSFIMWGKLLQCMSFATKTSKQINVVYTIHGTTGEMIDYLCDVMLSSLQNSAYVIKSH